MQLLAPPCHRRSGTAWRCENQWVSGMMLAVVNAFLPPGYGWFDVMGGPPSGNPAMSALTSATFYIRPLHTLFLMRTPGLGLTGEMQLGHSSPHHHSFPILQPLH